MRRTGKLYSLTVASSCLTVIASVLIILWNKNSSPIHLWGDIVPQGFGMASMITSTLIVGRSCKRFCIRYWLFIYIQAMIASVKKEEMAVATGSKAWILCYLADVDCTFPVTYLFRTTGQVLGVSLSGAILQAVLTKKLQERIRGPGSAEVSHHFSSLSGLDWSSTPAGHR